MKMLMEFPKKKKDISVISRVVPINISIPLLTVKLRGRMVVYQALYGEKSYWVRPEKMFFETIERDGRRFSRFTEIDI